MNSEDDVAPRPRGRRVVVSVLAWALAVVAAGPLFGLIDLGTTLGLADPAYRWSMSLEASWGSLFTFVVATGFGWIGATPRRPWPGLVLLALAAMGLAAGGAILGDPGPLWIAVPLAVVTVTFAWALRPYLRATRPAWQPTSSPQAVVAVAGIPLWLMYTWHSYRAAGDAASGTGDDTVGIDHWPVQIALGLIVAVGSGLLVGAGRDIMLLRWSFGLTSVAVAWATLAYPDRAGAMPHPTWGVLIALWGVPLALPAHRRLRPLPA